MKHKAAKLQICYETPMNRLSSNKSDTNKNHNSILYLIVENKTYICSENTKIERGPTVPSLLKIMIDKAKIQELVQEHIAGTDQFLVDIKLSVNRLGVSIDKPTGITLEECTSLSRFIIDQLEPTGFLETHEVEVGSPGMDSPLMVPQQYLRRIGRELKVVTTEGREMKAVLESADENGIQLKETTSRKENKKKIISEVTHQLTYGEIREAKLVINFKFK